VWVGGWVGCVCVCGVVRLARVRGTRSLIGAVAVDESVGGGVGGWVGMFVCVAVYVCGCDGVDTSRTTRV